MRAIIDGAGRVLAWGGESLVTPEGGQAVETDDNPLEGVGTDQEAYYDGAAFGIRPRVIGAEEQTFRDDVQLLRAYHAAATPTQAQSVAAIKATIRMLRRVFIELRDE
jgi:hypothetical protein